MKLDIQNVVDNITAVGRKIGAESISWTPNFSWNSFDPNGFRERLITVGEVEGVDIIDVIVSTDWTLEFAGRKVLVYIRDIRNYEPKFHVADCITLQNARNDGRYEKYVVSTKIDGKFKMREINPSGETIDSVRELKVCRNCLERLKYKNYDKLNTWRQKNDIRDKFSIKEFFEQYKATDIVQPKRNADTDPTNVYPKDWSTISSLRKQRKNFTCEKCGIYLKPTPNFLEVHHKNRRKDDNRPENLEVLCVDCHSKQGADHSHIKNSREYKEFMKIYKRIDS